MFSPTELQTQRQYRSVYFLTHTIDRTHGRADIPSQTSIRIGLPHVGFYGVMVSTQDSESCDPSSNLGRTCLFFSIFGHAIYTRLLFLQIVWWTSRGVANSATSRSPLFCPRQAIRSASEMEVTWAPTRRRIEERVELSVSMILCAARNTMRISQ